jgi:hypothetical protein
MAVVLFVIEFKRLTFIFEHKNHTHRPAALMAYRCRLVALVGGVMNWIQA